MESDKKFIVTKSEIVADKLSALGLRLFSKDNDTFIFENAPNKQYSTDVVTDVVFTNRVFL